MIVERATEARENDQDRKLKKKDQERSKNMIEFAMLCDWTLTSVILSGSNLRKHWRCFVQTSHQASAIHVC